MNQSTSEAKEVSSAAQTKPARNSQPSRTPKLTNPLLLKTMVTCLPSDNQSVISISLVNQLKVIDLNLHKIENLLRLMLGVGKFHYIVDQELGYVVKEIRLFGEIILVGRITGKCNRLIKVEIIKGLIVDKEIIFIPALERT